MSREEYIEELEERIIRLIAERDAAIAERDEAITRTVRLENENLELRRKLAFYEGPHTPPSHETLKKKETKDRGEKRKRGAPIGHKGATRKIPEPENTVSVKSDKCANCGKDPGKPIATEEKVTEELVSPPTIKATRFILYKYKCQHCGHKYTAKHKDCPQKGDFGVNLLTYVTMLKYHLRGPYRRVQEFMLHQNNFEISLKGLMDIILRVGEVCKNEYLRIIDRVRTADWVHLDETEMKENGEKRWFWIVRSNKNDVLVLVRKSRGAMVVKEILGEAFEGPAVVDGWPAYSFIKIVQRCWSHLIREVDEFKDVSENGKRLSEEIHSRYTMLKSFLEKDPPMETRKRQKEVFDREMEDVVERYDKHRELQKPLTYIRGGLGNWHTCLLYPGMEPTNNLGEQALREHVIMRKIIGCFRSENGSQNYQYISSLLASWKLQGKNMFVELEKLLRRDLCLA